MPFLLALARYRIIIVKYNFNAFNAFIYPNHHLHRTQNTEEIKSGASGPQIRDAFIKLGKYLASKGNSKVQVELRNATPPLTFRADPSDPGQNQLIKLIINMSRVEQEDMNGLVKSLMHTNCSISLCLYFLFRCSFSPPPKGPERYIA